MSGQDNRTAMEATGARLGELLRQALADRLARPQDAFPQAGAEREAAGDRVMKGLSLADEPGGQWPAQNRGDTTR
jgi:hypothetical protein